MTMEHLPHSVHVQISGDLVPCNLKGCDCSQVMAYDQFQASEWLAEGCKHLGTEMSEGGWASCRGGLTCRGTGFL